MNYDWRKDSLDCWKLAIRLISLRIGAVRFETVSEMYWIEQNGGIP